jgi:hypothetical protein
MLKTLSRFPIALFGLSIFLCSPERALAQSLRPVNPFGVGYFSATPFGQMKPFGQVEMLENLDTFKFEAGSQYQYNSNVFMMPTASNLVPSGTTRADSITTSYIGLGFEKDYGMQHFVLDMSAVNQKYASSSFMDYSAFNYEARWLASITPSLKADVSALQTVTPRGPETYGASPPTQAQINTVQSEGVIFDLSPYKVVHVYAGYNYQSTVTSNQTTSGLINTGGVNPLYNNNQSQIITGLGYEFSSGTLFKLMNKNVNGTQPEYLIWDVGPTFKKNETVLSVVWPVTGSSTLTGSYGYSATNYGGDSLRNYSGQIGGLEYEKKINKDSTVNLKYEHGMQSYTTQSTSYDVVDALILSTNWVVTPRFNVKPSVTIARQQFPTLGGFADLSRTDNSFVYTLEATWKATEKFRVRGLIAYVDRQSNYATYTTNNAIASLSAEIYF